MIRKAQEKDIPALKAIYNEAVLHTVATFDTEVKDDTNRENWFAEHAQEPYIIYVEELEGEIAGYASLSRYHERKAFDQTVEISVYIHREFRGKGIGRRLMEATLNYAEKTQSIHVVVSLITGENAASIHLHEKLGFIYCGTLKQIGFKAGRWLDLNFYQITYNRN